MLMVVVVVMVISGGAGRGDSFSTRISSAAVKVLAVVVPWSWWCGFGRKQCRR
jgi:hypothetical protein